MSRYNFYLINILFCIQLQAQQAPDYFINETSIENLYKGNLMVRLESKDKKIRFINEAMNSSECDQKCKNKLQLKIDELIKERDRFNLQFMKSFEIYFSFCPVYFYYDIDHQELVKSNFNGNFFLDKKLQHFKIDTFHQDSNFILKKDITPNSENEGWLIQTSNGYTLKNGFPFVSENNFKTIWNWITSTDHVAKNCDYMVKELNKKLYEFLSGETLDNKLRFIPYLDPSYRIHPPPPPPSFIPFKR